MVMGQLTTKTDVAVIGGGPAGYTAAIRAAQLGMDVLLVEKDRLGGCCTNVGCIPSKALIHAAELKHAAESDGAKKMGIDAKVGFDFRKAMAWKDAVVGDLRNGIGTLLKLNGVEVVKGRAFFTSSDSLSVATEAGPRAIEFRKAIIATGSTAKGLGNVPFDHEGIIDSDDVFALAGLPERLVIYGGGYIAVEMASMFLKFGSRVTILYRGERLLRNMEPEISDALLKGMTKLGGEVLFRSEIVRCEGKAAIVKTPDGEKRVGFDRLLVAVGREPYLEGLGLEKTKVKVNEDGLIAVDGTMRTGDASIYAIGDIVPGPQLAHKAFREAKVAAEAIAGLKSAFDNEGIPMAVFSDPEIASVGLTEEEAKAKGHKVAAGKMPLTASGRAKTMGRAEGFVKIVADAGSGAVLGVHIAGAGAGDLIAEGTLALEMGAMLEDLAGTIHAHPTMPEALMEAAEDALGKAIHLYRGKKG
jgi:dihydrolipoamide dehydrogenase